MDLAAVSTIFARYADQFVAVYMFGSVAAGTADEHSDIDVIVVRHTTQPFFDRMRAYAAGRHDASAPVQGGPPPEA